MPLQYTRRDVLKTAALGALALPAWSSALRAAGETPTKDAREHGLRLGVATYSTRMLSLEATIEAIKAVRLANAGVYKAHCNWETASVDECRAVGAKFAAAGIAITGSGVINLSKDEAKSRQAFDNAKAGGMATMIIKPAVDALPLVEKLAQEYDQKVAIHNHGPEDKVWPSPYLVFDAVQKLDARIGLCLDVGHTMRAGVDPVAAIKKCAPRLYDLHLKDSVAIAGAKEDLPVEVGAGRMDIRGMLQALRAIKYGGVVAFEYEKATGNPVTGLAESVGYVRGMLAALG